jgi:Na+/phosphate symporter
MTENKELSQLARQLLGSQNAVKFYTQQEFDEAMAIAKAEIMMVAIETTKMAIKFEREECAKLADECVDIEKLGDVIRNRMPAQRQ